MPGSQHVLLKDSTAPNGCASLGKRQGEEPNAHYAAVN